MLIKYLFPAAIAFQYFSITIVMVTFGLSGSYAVAADIGIVQSAVVAVFLSLSGNARNLILADDTNTISGQLLKLRVYLVIPVLFLSFALLKPFVDFTNILVVAIVIRKSGEWFAELIITEYEIANDKRFALSIVIVEAVLLFFISASIIFRFDQLIWLLIYVWALLPIIVTTGSIKTLLNTKLDLQLLRRNNVFSHIGSSSIISVSVYVFRSIIILIAGKTLAGVIFSAYAIGGMINSLYTYAVGPSMVAERKKTAGNKSVNTELALMILLAVSGLLMVMCARMMATPETNQYLLVQTTGVSIIASAIMILAQKRRIELIQVDKSNILPFDALINIFIISITPFGYYLFGVKFFIFLFLINSIINYGVYKIPEFISKRVFNYTSATSSIDREYSITQSIVLALFFFPVFFLLDGSIFESKEIVYDSGGKLLELPLPLGMAMCFIGLACFMYKKNLQASTLFIFFYFICMLTSTIFLLPSNSDIMLDRFIFQMQFIIPAFALFLGQSYLEPTCNKYKYETVLLGILVLIIPLQLIATYIQDMGGILTPYLYFFSLYQHLQYLPAIFVAMYLLAYFSLYQSRNIHYLLLLLLPVIVFYAFSSLSKSAIIELCAGLAVLIYVISNTNSAWAKLVFFIVISTVSIFAASLFFNDYFSWRLQTSGPGAIYEGVLERIHIYRYYVNAIFSNPESFLFGQEERPSRDVNTSAHNYYLDLMYNFGFISLTPVLALLIYTSNKVIVCLKSGLIDIRLFCLIMVVAFLLFFENSLKVGLRQPYPGLITFFLWGKLINDLECLYQRRKINTRFS